MSTPSSPLTVSMVAFLTFASLLLTAADVSFGQGFLEYRPSAEPRQPRFGWAHWWETNRDQYLNEHVTRSTQQSDAWQGLRDDVVPDLLAASTSEVANLRAMAILALGRLGGDAAADRVLLDSVGGRVAAVRDPDARVRLSAWMALGLIGNVRCSEALLDPAIAAMHEADHAARVIGIGLLPRLDARHVDVLLRVIVNGPGDEVSRLAVWALRVHQVERTLPLMSQIVRQTSAAFAVQEALLAFGAGQRKMDIDLLCEILNYYAINGNLPAYREIGRWVSELTAPRSIDAP